MTSEKYFLKWVKEAGRGHIAAFFSWSSLAGYTLIKGVQLSLSTEYHFFGMGSRELLWICAGLGLLLSLLEFFYLLQPGKLDFYYSLPVKKSTIFWSRYVHGFGNFMIPFCLAAMACGLIESSFEPDFFPYAGSYTGHSLLAYSAVFLIFYHMGILLLTICGNIIPVILGYVICLFYGHILVGNVFTAWAENYFRTYYRIPLFEKMDVILAPFSLGREMTGGDLSDKRMVFEYVPSKAVIAAALGWIIFSFLFFALAQKRRKTEYVGKIFVLPLAERTAEFLLSFLAGVWSGSFFMDLSGLAEEHPAAGAAISILAGAFSAAAVHFLMEWEVDAAGMHVSNGIRTGKFQRGLFRRKWQLAGECAAAGLAGVIFFAGASSFDSFQPEENEVGAIGISVDGIGMNQESCTQILLHGNRYETAEQLEKYVLAKEGKMAAQAWAASLTEKKNSSGYPHAAVCYYMKNGTEVYRLYPVDEQDFQNFSSVYETDEYKKIAYPSAEGGQLADARFNWSDGITDTALKLTGEEKESIMEAYRKDVKNLKMEDLGEALPIGFVDIDSEMRQLSGSLAVYPFFTHMCVLLEKYGVPIHKTLSDYSVRSVSVRSVSADGMGKSDFQYYEEPGEMEQWIQKAVPERFDLQPLLYPLDYSQEIRAEVNDEMTNSIVNVYCYALGK